MKKQFLIGILIGGIIALTSFFVWRTYFMPPTNSDGQFSCWTTPPAESNLQPYRQTGCSERDEKACMKGGGKYVTFSNCNDPKGYEHDECRPNNLKLPTLKACDLGIGTSSDWDCSCGSDRCWDVKKKKCVPADTGNHPL